VVNFMAVSRSFVLRASKMVRATSDGVGVSVSIGPPCCGVYVEKATQPVPTVPPVLAGHKGTAMLRRYIREGSLFRENAASAVGL
jgi:hypothetical protein